MAGSSISLRERVSAPEVQDAFKRWFDASPAYSGSVTVNRLGWQVLRTVAKNTAITVRPRRAGAHLPLEYTRALDRDGIVVIPDYLSTERYQRLRAAFTRYADSSLVRDIGDENDSHLVYRTGPVVSEHPGDAAEQMATILASDPLILGLAEYVIHRRIHGPLKVVYQDLVYGESPDDNDREQLLHTDKYFSCAKAIYFVDAVTSESSPFVYCPGSHRLTVERLRWEHAMSTREALLRSERVDEFDRFERVGFDRSRNTVGPDSRSRLALVERPITCGPNTLVVVNNRGFHRRGSLAPGERRRSLWVNFYPYQRPPYGRLAFRAAKRFFDTDNVPRSLADVHRQTLD
jgi:hypothetical protein